MTPPPMTTTRAREGKVGESVTPRRYRLAHLPVSATSDSPRAYGCAMGSVSGSESITINAPIAEVLAAIRDLPAQPKWFPGCMSSQVLTTGDDGLPLRARQVNDVKIAKDEYELDYSHTDSGMSWTLVSPSKAQKAASGSWTLKEKGAGTEATLHLDIDPAIPLPGFLLKKTLGDTLKGATKGLKKYCDG